MNRDQEKDFVDETLAFWQPRSSSKLSRGDAHEIIHNVTNYFAVLSRWDDAENLKPTETENPSPKR